MEVVPGKPSTQSGTAALTALRKACEELKEGVLDALVTGPIDKHAVHSTDFPFAGHTEFLTQHFGATESLMLMVGESLRVGLVTEHVAIKDVAQYITREKVESKLRILEQSLRKDFGISKPRIAVLGLNPHAGDSGLIGQEEEQVLKPLISDFRNKGKLVYGPFSPDGFFATGQHVKYDAVLAMYHDQGLIPFKSIAFEDGVNFTAGLPIVRTSPDHGTAFNIAGKNMANEGSLRSAVYKAVEILRYRGDNGIE
jgi:4-hydroxythreonine-4-phosphate dehydrogenase